MQPQGQSWIVERMWLQFVMHMFSRLLLMLQNSSATQSHKPMVQHAPMVQQVFWTGFVGIYWPRVPTVLVIPSHHQDAVTAEEAPGPVHAAPTGPPELSEAEGTRARPAGSPA